MRVEYTERFESVWQLRWSTKGKSQAFKEWSRLDEDDKTQVIEVMPVHRAEYARQSMRYRPHLSTWLHQRKFEDELSDPCEEAHRRSTEHDIQVERFGYASFGG